MVCGSDLRCGWPRQDEKASFKASRPDVRPEPLRDRLCELRFHVSFVKHELPGLAHDEVKAAAEGKYDPGEMMCSCSFSPRCRRPSRRMA